MPVSGDVRDAPGLQNVEGREAARAIAAVAMGEPLWSKLNAEAGNTSTPTHPDVLVWDTSRVDSTLDSPTGESTRRYQEATDAADESGSLEDDLLFSFKMASPSSKFYQVWFG